jgi:hypothetical protein
METRRETGWGYGSRQRDEWRGDLDGGDQKTL